MNYAQQNIFKICATATRQEQCTLLSSGQCVCVVFCAYESSVDLLIEDEVRGKVEQLSIGVFVGAPAEAKGGQTHP